MKLTEYPKGSHEAEAQLLRASRAQADCRDRLERIKTQLAEAEAELERAVITTENATNIVLGSSVRRP